MSWVAWKQRHLWSGAPRTTCYSSGWSIYYYNCRCWAKTWLCWVILEYFHQSDQKKNYVFQLDSYKNTCVYSFLWIAIHWVCRIDTNRSDKISMHRDAPVNRYTPVGVFQFLLFTTSIPNVLQYLQKYSGPYKVLTVWSLMISIWNYIPRCIHKTILKQS